MTTLIDTAAAGAVPETRRLLADGCELNVRGAGGNTALHEAVRHGHHYLAALLLTHGIDWAARNDTDMSALDPEFSDLDTLHRIRQEYQRYPLAPYETTSRSPDDIELQTGRLRRDGVVKISGFLHADEIRRMQSAFSRIVEEIGGEGGAPPEKCFSKYDQEEYWHPKHRSYVTNDALRYSLDLVALCCNTYVSELANHYLRKRAHVKRAYGMRYLPSVSMDSNQFHWHHDMEDRQLKVMILLTDVEEHDQHMSYVRGAHNLFHPYPRFLKNVLDFDYYRPHLDQIDIMKLTGRAGDLFFFDSNGMHRGNRSEGRVRDAFFVEFTTDRNRNNLWGSEIARDRVPASARDPEHPLGPLLSVTPKWTRTKGKTRRKMPTWAGSLPHPAEWL